jgi:hypothetical protein
VSRRTARDARSLLHTILGDAASARPPLIPFNPAARPRNRGRRTGRRLDRSPQRAWATPLEVLLAAERAALPTAAWTPTLPGKPFAPPSGRGIPHLVSKDGTGDCSSSRRAVRLRLDGKTVTHKTEGEHCPGSGQQPDDDAPLACWLPVKNG